MYFTRTRVGSRDIFETCVPQTQTNAIRRTGQTLLHGDIYKVLPHGDIYEVFRGPTPEWVGWTVTGPSPAEGHLPWPGVLLVGELAQVPHYPEI